MSDVPSPELLPEALDGRFASVVHIMKGRRSPFSHLGVLWLEAGQLSLQDRKGALLFAVPAASVQASPARRRSAEMHRPAFEIHAADRWWSLVSHVPTKYEWHSTQDLAELFRARELAPRPTGMSEETYLRLTANPISHQLLWRACWLKALSGPDLPRVPIRLVRNAWAAGGVIAPGNIRLLNLGWLMLRRTLPVGQIARNAAVADRHPDPGLITLAGMARTVLCSVAAPRMHPIAERWLRGFLYRFRTRRRGCDLRFGRIAMLGQDDRLCLFACST